MQTKGDKKANIRQQIINASRIYSSELAGKVFMYIIGDRCFEVVFRTDSFMHLTGVSSNLAAQKFYENAKHAKLTTEQFDFDSRYPFHTARKKLPCLQRLPILTNSLVCVVDGLKTKTFTYKIGVTDFEFTIGLTENTDYDGKVINGWFVPRTLRVKDNALANSDEAELVDFILTKSATVELYDKISYKDNNKDFPISLARYLSPQLKQQLNMKE